MLLQNTTGTNSSADSGVLGFIERQLTAPTTGMQQILPIASLATAIAERRADATAGTGPLAERISNTTEFIAVRGEELLNQAGELLQPVLQSPTADLTEAERQLLCSQAPEAGECRAAIQRWHYDAATGGCKMFTYGGCGGNGNNFGSAALCIAGCRGVDAGAEGTGGMSPAVSAGTAAEGPVEVTVLPGDVVNGGSSSSYSSGSGNEGSGGCPPPQQQQKSSAGLSAVKGLGLGLTSLALAVASALL